VTTSDTAQEPHAPGAEAEETARASEDHRSTTRSIIEWIAVIGGALIVALVIKTFLIQAFYIPSGSMETTLEIGDRVLVNKLSYPKGTVASPSTRPRPPRPRAASRT